jgi:branched-chain amino acid transport system substrate-binding protein
MTRSRQWGIMLAGALAAGAAGMASAAAQDIKIGEINSYTSQPAFTAAYKKGWELAVKEINDKGGVGGRKLLVISRDDDGKPSDAVKIAEELVSNDKVALIAGTFLSNIGLAVTDFANQRKVLFLASEPLSDAIVWAKGNDYTFRLRPSTTMQAMMLAKEAVKAGKKRWATVAPNYAYGQDAVKAFKEAMKKLDPSVEFVAEQWPALGKIDAGATVRAIEQAKPDAIYNVTFATDLVLFAREGNARGLFDGRLVVGLLNGEPEYMEPLKGEMPKGWLVTGYPPEQITDPAHKAFLDAYTKAYGEAPKLGSLVGYNMIKTIEALLKKTGGNTDTATMIKAMKGLEVDSPSGKFMYRALDNQATMGAWVGKTDVKGGMGTMAEWYYADGKDYQLPDEEIKRMRPGS